ncbi:MAG: hypothetical protein U5R49_24745 [Deltaproteobacteria bacterium]|nr:hypothetical protein [Deltaproteobacteria bacterium]
MKLSIEGRTADLQVVRHYVKNKGSIDKTIEGADVMSWESAPKLNGIYLYNNLRKHHFKVALVNDFLTDQDKLKSLLSRTPLSIIISTTFIFNKKSLHKIIADIREMAPDIKIIVGGPFVYFSYLLQYRCREPDYFSDHDADDFLF